MQLKVPTWLLISGGIVLAALLAGAAYLGRVSAPAPPEPEPAFTYEPRPLLKEEWFEPQAPSSVTAYEAPDSSATLEYCGVFPEELIGETNRPRDTPRIDEAKTDSLDVPEPSQESNSQEGVGPTVPSSIPDLSLGEEPFLAVPLQDGVPTIRVTESRVGLQGYLPSNGRGVEYSWDVPTDKNAIELSAQTRLWKQGVGTTVEGRYVRDIALADLFGGAGWRGAPTGPAGWYGTVGVQVAIGF